jgi:hypothetical protein
VFQFMEDYSQYALARDLPGEVVLGLFGVLPWPALLGLMVVVLPLLFPDGRLVSPRWRPVVWTTIGASAATCLLTVLWSGPLHGVSGLPDNPSASTRPPHPLSRPCQSGSLWAISERRGF